MIERKVAIITGANAGVGFAIVQRLVAESPDPLTVILACRNKTRAQEALNKLHVYFDALQQKRKHEDGLQDIDAEINNPYHHPELKIELVDVGSVASVQAFNQRIRDQYRRIDYLFCNAGVLPSAGIMWGKLLVDLFVAPMDLVIRSDVLVQPKQHLTEDGIGNVLACNVFGHYLMIKGLEDLMSKTEEDPGRVIWTSSMTAEKGSFSNDDWQGLNSKQPYESSKWVTDLLAIRLNEVWAGQQSTIGSSSGSSRDMTSSIAAGITDLHSGASPESTSCTEATPNSGATTPARRVTRAASKAAMVSSTNSSGNTSPKLHIISIATQPGVVASGIGGLAFWIVMLRTALHYVVRFLGERNQTITGYHGAYSNVHAALQRPLEKLDYRCKYGSSCGRTGQEFLKVERVVEYEESQALVVVGELEKLRLSFTS
ncbi:hypothetical protein BGZ58_001301 [Dissophora ornata]|nr:hypothetical protein BGZ58_001301 [Dissophora ornata]